MATIIRDMDIIISVDPGFDGIKTTVNGINLFIPNLAVNITGKEKDFIKGFNKNFILSKYIKGISYLVGEHAEQITGIDSVERQLETVEGVNTSYKKFTTEESEVSILTSIGMALIKWAEINKLDVETVLGEKSMYTIWVGIALPESAMEETWPSVLQTLVGRKCFEIETEERTYNLDFVIEANHCQPTSQVKDAYWGTILNDEGDFYDGMENSMTTDLPAVVVDGGFKTIADFTLTRNLLVTNAESNTDYAMLNIYRSTIDFIKKEYSTEISIYKMKDILKNEGGIMYYLKDGKSASLDINVILEQEKERIAKEYIDYLCRKYNQLLDKKKIIISGGTGTAYYEYFKKFVEESRSHLKDKLVLTDYEFMGSKINPVFGISVGQYKVLKKLIKDLRNQQAAK